MDDKKGCDQKNCNKEECIPREQMLKVVGVYMLGYILLAIVCTLSHFLGPMHDAVIPT